MESAIWFHDCYLISVVKRQKSGKEKGILYTNFETDMFYPNERLRHPFYKLLPKEKEADER